jgi:A/G-specific adenine glycosylase
MTRQQFNLQLVLTILRWYRLNGRKLPWRGIRSPYRILVSEIMLQQTQVNRVLEKYPTFLKTFPTFQTLAGARRATVIRTWQGMGYNNRAVRLHILAQEIVDQHNGRLPRDYDLLRTLPGIGPYTARAILSSAFGMAEPVVDINIRRLFSRLFWKMPDTSAMRPEPEIWKLATELLPHHAAYDWNQALMDLGATVCTARAPRCTLCPIARFCKSRKRMQLPPHLGVARPFGPSPLGVVRSSSKREPQRGGPRKGGPYYRGIPTRIHRGRIVEELRRVPEGSWIGIGTLTKRVFENSKRDDVNWMEKIVCVLERDGLVQIDKKRVALM